MTDADVDRYLAEHGVKVIEGTLTPRQYQGRLEHEVRLLDLPEMGAERIGTDELLWREVRRILPDSAALMLHIQGYFPTEIAELLRISRPTAVARTKAETRRILELIPLTPTFYWWSVMADDGGIR